MHFNRIISYTMIKWRHRLQRLGEIFQIYENGLGWGEAIFLGMFICFDL